MPNVELTKDELFTLETLVRFEIAHVKEGNVHNGVHRITQLTELLYKLKAAGGR